MTISEYALKFIGLPYIWEAMVRASAVAVLIAAALSLSVFGRSGSCRRATSRRKGINDKLYAMGWRQGLSVKEGDVLFFGKDLHHITHTALAIGDGLMVEAGGGGSKCKTPATSTGMVWVRPITWRNNLVAALRGP